MRYSLGVIGCGNMGSALVRGIVKGRLLSSRRILVSDVDGAKVRGLARSLKVRAVCSGGALAASASVVVLAVKPQQMGEVLREIRDSRWSLPSAPTEGLPSAKACPRPRSRAGGGNDGEGSLLLISIAAGVPTRWIEERAGRAVRVVRVMPNTPALVGQGVSAIALGRSAGPKDGRLAERIFRCVGEVVRLTERQMDAVTAVSGSGPAYFFYLMEAMIRAGVSLGLSEAVARRLVVETAAGAARLASASGEDLAALRARVTSKGGTTEAAFRVFDRAGLGRTLHAGIRAAAKRAKELANTSLRAPIPPVIASPPRFVSLRATKSKHGGRSNLALKARSLRRPSASSR